MQNARVELPTPCGHVVYFPVFLAKKATEEGVSHVFHTICTCGKAYMVSTEPEGAYIRGRGEMRAVTDAYEALPWEEYQLQDQRGSFFFKKAPSLATLRKLLGSVGS
ncbi:MAG TPA: hypothetical protein VD902_19700 [Symbiobacteriaceae bacterium]|nr:hypothetical protein [Symbiobacteriaceae bacterium]